MVLRSIINIMSTGIDYMSKEFWSLEDTRDWIAQAENRVEDIDYYLRQTVAWCERHNVLDSDRVFTCSFLTIVWVSHQRSEKVSYRELLELLGLGHLDIEDDRVYDLGAQFANMDHEDMLQLIAGSVLDF